MKIYIESAGCSRRLAELASLRNYFELNGHVLVDKPGEADFIVAATCAFKKLEEDQSVERVKALKKYDTELLVYGCLPDIAPSKFHEFGDTRFLSPQNITQIDSIFKESKIKFSTIRQVNIIPEEITSSTLSSAVIKLKKEFEFSTSFFRRARDYSGKKIKKTLHLDQKKFYLFVCKGCLGKCSYCAIRRAIGPLKSNPVGDILSQFNDGLAQGYKDYVILGDDVGAYGRDKGTTFPELVNQLIEHFGSVCRNIDLMTAARNNIRLHVEEIHPKWMLLYKDEMLRLVSTKRIKSILCPVQSGNDRILELMRREHDADSIKILSDIRLLYPGIELLTQLIVGFPSETDREFNDSLDLVKEVGFDRVTLFPYDPKENTPAALIKPQIPVELIADRTRKALKFFKQHGIAAHLSCQN